MSENSVQNRICVHRLEGCRPTPLAHYLKALGVLRLVAEQADATARGWWAEDVFHLATKLSQEEIVKFFLDEYCPSPILSPWLKGSGFYDAEDVGLTPIERSATARLQNYRSGIADCRSLLAKIESADAVIRAIKARTKTDSSFQTGAQRDATKNSELFSSCIRSIESELQQITNRQTSPQATPEDTKLIAKLNEQVATIKGIVAEPGVDPKTGQDRRPTRVESDQLKESLGYKRFLKHAESEFAKQKDALLSNCKKNWRGAVADWFSVAVVIEDDESAKWPSLLGTGGNDGNLDFTNNFMQRLHDLFDFETGEPTVLSQRQIVPSLFNSNSRDLQSAPTGQYFPTSTGGPNCGSGFTGSVALNFWDYVLMFEGTLLFRAGVSRRLAASSLPQASAPFAVRTSGIGYASADTSDEGARGEQWMPLWSRPSCLSEVQNLFQQAKSQVGRSSVTRGTSMVRAVARLGTARGISHFQRFGYIERNGLSNLAVPLGRFCVRGQEHQDLLDRAAVWIDQLRRIATGKNAPNSLLRVQRNCEDAIVHCTQKADVSAFLALLVAMADAEDQFIMSPKYSADASARPIPRLSYDWLEMLMADSSLRNDVEFRLALSLSAQFGNLSSREEASEENRILMRDFWLPLERNHVNFLKGERGLAIGPGQCAVGLPLEKALMKIFQRRLHAVDQGKGAQNAPFQLIRNELGASLEQIQAFINSSVDDAKILSMARALMAIDFRNVRVRRTDAAKRDPSSIDSTAKPENSPLAGMATYGVMRLVFGGGTKRKGGIRITESNEVHMQADATIFNRLAAGDLNGALTRAIHRASISGLRPRIQVGVGSAAFARRIAASLCFGVSDAVMTRLALGLTSPTIAFDDTAFVETD